MVLALFVFGFAAYLFIHAAFSKNIPNGNFEEWVEYIVSDNNFVDAFVNYIVRMAVFLITFLAFSFLLNQIVKMANVCD